MAIDAIKKTILADAREQGRVIVANAEREATRRARDAEEASRRRLEEARKLGEANVAAERERSVSVTELQVRDRLLAAKHDILAEAVNAAKSLVDELSEDEYEAVLVDLIAARATRSSEIIFDEALGEDARSRIILRINERLAGRGAPPVVAVSEDRPIGRGFIIAVGRVEEDWSFDRRLEALAEEREAELSEILFREH